MLNATDAAGVFINITVVAIAGRIDEQVDDEKGDQGIFKIYLRYLAEGQKKYRHQKKGEGNSQQLDRVV
jgi:hypothetical protein